MSPWKQKERDLNARYEAGQRRMFWFSLRPMTKRTIVDGEVKEEVVFVGHTYRRSIHG